MTGRRHPLVDLHEVHTLPGHVFAGQGPQHRPRRAAAADGQHEAAVLRHGGAGLRGNDRRRRPAGRRRVGEPLDLHGLPLSFR